MNSNLDSSDIDLLAKDLFDAVLDVTSNGIELHGVDYFEDQSLSSIWLATARVGQAFSKRTEAFLWIFERLLRQGRIKLHRNGVFLESSVKEQVDAFRSAWPRSVADSGYEDFYWWFFDPECPAGVAWRHDDGNYVIAD
ncbi:DUF596 domain-containing protein [Hydrogenophaga sp.]|uniref:DUF596 domain-containing protein n=1 Tax=Hydrogenophaga sp. TaxID=1904254 RepID=UPI0027199047|nr:DUF596 domain-containing protein [Hydrogenophaga sp.]MDO9437080.1 DUF596 domain-containing protein [Hydrogenophaga sp.]